VEELVLGDEAGGLELLAEVARFLRHNRNARPTGAPWSHRVVKQFVAAANRLAKNLGRLDFREQQTGLSAKYSSIWSRCSAVRRSKRQSPGIGHLSRLSIFRDTRLSSPKTGKDGCYGQVENGRKPRRRRDDRPRSDRDFDDYCYGLNETAASVNPKEQMRKSMLLWVERM
jgi:hypothetical protein